LEIPQNKRFQRRQNEQHFNEQWKVSFFPDIDTSWMMKGLRAALPRRSWGYWWMKSWT